MFRPRAAAGRLNAWPTPLEIGDGKRRALNFLMKNSIGLQSDINDLVTSLHQGVFERPYWASFLDKIRAVTHADYASLVFRRSDIKCDDINIIRSYGNICNPDNSIGGEITDRLNLFYHSLQENRPYTLEEIVNIDDPGNVEYIDYLRSRHIKSAVVIRVCGSAQGNGWLTIGRSCGAFAPWVIALMSQIAPNLSIAVRTLAELERAQMRAEVANDAVQRLNYGWLTFDANGDVVEIDPVAAGLFTQIPKLSGCACGSAFPVGLSGRERSLTDILAELALDHRAQPRAMHLVDDPWLDMLVVPIAYRSVSGGPKPIAVGYVHGVAIASEHRCAQLKQLFGLTGSEARLALAMSQGSTIAEAAAALHFTVETARNYSKKIYAKTNTRGRADLVRIILGSVIALV